MNDATLTPPPTVEPNLAATVFFNGTMLAAPLGIAALMLLYFVARLFVREW